MQQAQTKQIDLQLQKDNLAIDRLKTKLGYTTKEIIDSLTSQAFFKTVEYKSKMEPYEKKYKMRFPQFRNWIRNIKEENFEAEDDFILWEGFYEMYQSWKDKYQVLSNYVF